MSKNIDNINFFIGEPDEGGKEVSHYEYNKADGLIDHFKKAGITIRYTHSLEEMKRQHETLWHECLEQFKKDAEKNGNHVEEADMQRVRKFYLEEEITLFTGYLAGNKSKNEKNEIKKYLDYLKMEIERLADGKQKAGTLSFSWTGSPEQLEAFCQALIKTGYIHPDTTNETFIAIFASELIKDKPVQWLGSNRLLSYLFNQMYSCSLILSQDWQSIIERYQIFKNKRGKILKAGDLSTALSNINDVNTGLEPKGYEIIDKILKNLKTLRP
jgi:hypothetical protein